MAVEFSAAVGSANSTSYVTVEEFLQYWENLNGSIYATLNALDSDDQKRLCNRGSQYLDAAFEPKDGERANPDGSTAALAQALNYPRSNATDDQGDALSATIIPKAIKDAACEAAYRAQLQGTADLIPDQGRATKKEKLEGVGEFEYMDNKSLSDKQYIKIQEMLRGWIKDNSIFKLSRS